MSRAAVAVAVLAVFLAEGPAANAAATVRVELFPKQPRVNQVATLQLRTFWTLLDGTRPPAIFPERYRWTIAALSPGGRTVRIRVARESANPYQWRATLRFASPDRC